MIVAVMLLSNVFAGPVDSPMVNDSGLIVPDFPGFPLPGKMLGGDGVSSVPQTLEPQEAFPERPASHLPVDRDVVIAEYEPREPKSTNTPTQGPLDCLPHPPIEIRGDQGPNGFVLTQVAGVPVYRPGSGVTSGTGTLEDPYVIEGWCIDPLPNLKERRGIEIRDTTAHVEIRNNQVTGFQWAAISLEHAQGVTVRDNLFVGNDQALYTRNTEDIVFKENQVEGYVGASVLSSPGAIVHGNHIDVTIEGVHVTDSPGAQVTQNSVKSGPFGISVSDSTGVLVQGNTVQADWAGIDIRHTDDTTVQDNQVSGGDHGILLEYITGTTVQGNTVTGNARGLLAWGYTGLIVEGNTLTGNENGLRIEHGEDAVIIGNIVAGNHQRGMFLFDNHFPLIKDNLIRDNNEDGILSWDQYDAVIRGNHIEGNRNGITLSNQYGLNMEGNTVLGEGVMGIRILSSWWAIMRDNHVQGNTYGILADQNEDLLIEKNTLTHNLWSALWATGGTGVTIRENHLEGNGNPIINGQSRDVLIEANTVLDNDWSVVQVYSCDGPLAIRDNLLFDTEDKPSVRPSIWISQCDGALITGNTLQSPQPADTRYATRDQIALHQSKNGEIRDNTLSSGGLLIGGDHLDHYVHTLSGNTVAGRPVVYLHGVPDAVIAPGAAQVILVESPRAIIQGHAYTDIHVPVILAESDNVGILDLTARNAELGVLAFNSHGLRLEDSLIEHSWAGAILFGSDDARITGNRFNENQVGIVLLSQGSQVRHNDLTNNNYGLALIDSKDILIERNEIHLNTQLGILVAGETNGDQGGHTVHDNNIRTGHELVPGIQPGAWVDSVFTLDARFNWWGCSDGPGEPGCDTVEGNVDASGWRTDPVLDAGAP